MPVFTLTYILKRLKDRDTRPADFAAAVLRLSAREIEAREAKGHADETGQMPTRLDERGSA